MKFENILGVAILLALLLTAVPAISQDKLLIIAPDDYLDELEPLRRFKEATGRHTSLVSLTQVYSNSTIGDAPERIKRYIANVVQTDPSFHHIMLVGDCNRFPVRYACLDYLVPLGYQPTDLYYASLFRTGTTVDTWDGNGNGIYGELQSSSAQNNVDNVSWYCDVALTRLPASDETEVSRYVEKSIRYEVLTSGASWFRKVLLVTGDSKNPDLGDVEGFKDNLAANYLPTFTPITHYLPDLIDAYPNLDDRAKILTDKINKGVGFTNYSSHGKHNRWSDAYRVTDMPGLTNVDKLTVAFAQACSTAEFAPQPPHQRYRDTTGTIWEADDPNVPVPVPTPDPIQPDSCDHESMAEAFLCKWAGEAGAIAYMGSAGTDNSGWGQPMDEDFFYTYSLGYRTFGGLFVFTMNQHLSRELDGSGNFKAAGEWQRRKAWAAATRYMGFGDPSVIVGGAFTVISGQVWDGFYGPFNSYTRFRVTGNVSVPAGTGLTARAASSVLVDNGKKITALDPSPYHGFAVEGTTAQPTYVFALGPDLASDKLVRGIKVTGEMRVWNGGEIKLH